MEKKSPVVLMAILYASAFLAGFNENLVNMALMSIMSDFSVDSITVQWLVTGYMIVATVVVMCMAFLYQRFTLRQLYFSGAIFSIVGSAMGLFAPSFEILMTARLIQALAHNVCDELHVRFASRVRQMNSIVAYPIVMPIARRRPIDNRYVAVPFRNIINDLVGRGLAQGVGSDRT